MPGLFSTSAQLTNHTLLPPETTHALFLSLIRDHDFLIRLDPEIQSYVASPTPTSPAPKDPSTKYYKVTDVMHTLPRGLWDTTVSYDTELTDQEDGIHWIVRAPLGLVQTSIWRVKEGGEDGVGKGMGRLWLVEDVDIKGSRLIVGTVKGKCEGNWRGVHGKFVKRLEDTIKAEIEKSKNSS